MNLHTERGHLAEAAEALDWYAYELTRDDLPTLVRDQLQIIVKGLQRDFNRRTKLLAEAAGR